jgi:prevent-host-death family protein
MSVTVGVRELRENLKDYLERAKTGEEVVITERGKPVARLIGQPSKVDQRGCSERAGKKTRGDGARCSWDRELSAAADSSGLTLCPNRAV